MTTEHRRAPRREVVSIERTGRWGQVTYQHKLSCGHVESRQRPAQSQTLACAWCLRTSSIDQEMKALTSPQIPTHIKEEQSIVDLEMDVEKLRAGIASKFSIPVDAVDISVQDIRGELVITSAIVFLSAIDVGRLGRQ
jgi:hypothetical protein